MSLTNQELLHLATSARKAGFLPPAALLNCHIYLANVDETGLPDEKSHSLLLPALRDLAKVLESMLLSAPPRLREVIRSDINLIRDHVQTKAEASTSPRIRALAASIREDRAEFLVSRGLISGALIGLQNGRQYISDNAEFYFSYQCAVSWLASSAGDTKLADRLIAAVTDAIPTANPTRQDKQISAHLHFRKMIAAANGGHKVKMRDHFEEATEAYKSVDTVRKSYWLGLLYCSYGYSSYTFNEGGDNLAQAEAINYFRVGRSMIPGRVLSCFSTIPPIPTCGKSELAIVQKLEHEAKDQNRLKHLNGYEIEGDYKKWKELRDRKQIDLLTSAIRFDPILKKPVLPKSKYVTPSSFVLSQATIDEVARQFCLWRQKTIGRLLLNIPLGEKLKVLQFMMKHALE